MKRRELPVSTTVGDAYRVFRRIGDGARGTVYEARDLRRNQRCALKLMDGVIAESAEALATFHSQAEIASRPLHPQLLPVLDFGTADTGEPFVVTAFLDGEDLGARLRRRPGSGNAVRFEPPLVGFHILQAAQGLAVAHKQGLYHLGLKPTNLFLVPQPDGPDQIQVLDFGLSQVVNALQLEGHTRLEDSLPFVSPEQSGGRNDPLDDRCDQWALACVAWQMLTGAPPFTGVDGTALLYQVAFEDPQPDPAAAVPDTVLAVLDRALSKRPEDRFPDILEFGSALEAACGPLLLPRRAKRQKAPAAPAARPPVFLPGMSPRAAEPSRRSSAAAPTRLKGLRVRGPSEPSGPPEPESVAREGATPVMEMPTAAAPAGPDAGTTPVVATGLWRRLTARLGAPSTRLDRRRVLLFGVLPASAAILAMGTWGALRHKTPPVAVERPPRPTIVPLKATTASTAMKRSRKRARRARSRKRVAD